MELAALGAEAVTVTALQAFRECGLENWKKPHFRYPRRRHLNPKPISPLPEKPTIRRIMVDLRPALEQVMNSSEGDSSSSDSGSEGLSTLRAEASKQQEEGGKYRGSVSPPKRQITGELRIQLPPTVKSQGKSREPQGLQSPPMVKSQGKSRESHEEYRRVNLVAVTDDGTLTYHQEAKNGDPHPVCFPRVILSQEYSQKTTEKHRPPRHIPSEWLTVEKLQLPLSELVKAVRERADSGQHALITRVLCSIREKQEQLNSRQNVRVDEPPTGHLPQSRRIQHKQDCVKLTWAKRS
ncbi:uncharacterized protein O3C94_000858 [Discoglossus pictus]